MRTYQYKILIFLGRGYKILAVGVFLLIIFTGFLCVILKETSQLSEITFFAFLFAIVTGLYGIIFIPEERTVIQTDEEKIIFKKPSRKPTFSLEWKEIIIESAWQEIIKVIVSPLSWRKEAKVSVLTPKGNFSFVLGLSGYQELVETIKTKVAPEKIILIPRKDIKNVFYILLCILSILFGLFILFVAFYKK